MDRKPVGAIEGSAVKIACDDGDDVADGEAETVEDGWTDGGDESSGLGSDVEKSDDGNDEPDGANGIVEGTTDTEGDGSCDGQLVGPRGIFDGM